MAQRVFHSDTIAPPWSVHIPKGSKQLAGGKRSATTGRPRESDIHPGGMTAEENVRADRRSCLLSSLRDVRTHNSSFPVVALRLPPANVCNPFGMRKSPDRQGKRPIDIDKRNKNSAFAGSGLMQNAIFLRDIHQTRDPHASSPRGFQSQISRAE